MTAFDTTRTTYGTASAVNRFFAMLNDTTAAVVAWNVTRATRKALSSLTDRELEDIGFIRGDIDHLAQTNLNR